MTARKYAGIAFTQKNPDFDSLWLCQGSLGGMDLTISRLEELPQHQIHRELRSPPATAVGMTFPFSLPEKFISFWSDKRHQSNPGSWVELVERVLSISYEMFVVLAKEYSELTNRLTDERFRKLLPGPLYHAYPNLLRSCYRGLRLLASFDPSAHTVLPFFKSAYGETTWFLETSPRATLHCLGLASRPYRSIATREPSHFKDMRAKIIAELLSFCKHSRLSSADLPRLDLPRHLALCAANSPDALDSLISTYTSCLFCSRPEIFDDPFETDDPRVLLEGWLYAPYKYSDQLPP